jgi:hypothetical protein
VLLLQIINCSFHQFFKNLRVDVRELFDIDASRTLLEFAQALQEMFMLRGAGINIEGDCRFSRRKTNQRPVALLAASI